MIGWINNRELNDDYFFIQKFSKSNITLDYYLDRIDLDNYWIYKASGKFRRVEKEDIGKYSSYIFFRKDLYYKDNIDKWIEEIYKIHKSDFKYLTRPFPRIEILNKLEVI